MTLKKREWLCKGVEEVKEVNEVNAMGLFLLKGNNAQRMLALCGSIPKFWGVVTDSDQRNGNATSMQSDQRSHSPHPRYIVKLTARH